MKPADLLKAAGADGVTFHLIDPESVKVIGNDKALARWVPILRAHKTEILNLLHHPDDRRHCATCAHLSGKRCTATGLLVMDDLPRRCIDYRPLPNDPDQRTGAERWPWLDKPVEATTW